MAGLAPLVWAQVPDVIKPPRPPAAGATILFDGVDLPKDWRFFNAVEDHWIMQPKSKSLMINSLRAPCVSAAAGKNFLVYDRPLPADDFEVVVKASADFQSIGNQISAALWSDDKNYFSAGFEGYWSGGLQRHAYFQKVTHGESAGNTFAQNYGSSNEIYLRILREGNYYSGFFAAVDPAKPFDAAKIPWTQLGKLPGIRFTGKLALCAVNIRDDAPEVGAEFYSVTIRPK
jgi:hypothetical protein